MTIDITIIDVDDAVKAQIGVFEVTDTTMRCNFSEPGGTVRPTDFTPSDGFFAFTATKRK